LGAGFRTRAKSVMVGSCAVDPVMSKGLQETSQMTYLNAGSRRTRGWRHQVIRHRPIRRSSSRLLSDADSLQPNSLSQPLRKASQPLP